MADPVKTKDIYPKTSQSPNETSRKPLVARILTLNSYLKTLSVQQKTDPETLQEVNDVINDLTAIIGQPIDDEGQPIFFSIENPDEFLEVLAQMAENILPEGQINQGEIPANLSELVDQMEAQIEAEKAAQALVKKTGIKISEARKTVNQFILNQTLSAETAIKESTKMSPEEKRQFVPVAKRSIPVMVRQQLEETRPEINTPEKTLEQIEKINKKGKSQTPPVLTALKQKQDSLTNELGKFASIPIKLEAETIRIESKVIVDQLLGNQPVEVREKITDHTTASLVNQGRVRLPKTAQETVDLLSTAIKTSTKKADPSIDTEKVDVAQVVEKLNQIPESVISQALTRVSSQQSDQAREVAYEELVTAYEKTSDPKTALVLAQSDLVISEVFDTNQTADQPKVVVSKELITPAVLRTLPESIAPQQWVPLEEIQKAAPDLYESWLNGIDKDGTRKFFAIQTSAEQEPIPLSNYDPEGLNNSLLFIQQRADPLFSDQDLPQTNDVQEKVNFLRNLLRVWQKQGQTVSTVTMPEAATVFPQSTSRFFSTPLGQGLRTFGNFIKGKLSPVFKKLGGGILKKIGSTAAGQAAKGVLTKLGATAIGAISGIATGGLSLLLAAIPAVAGFIKNIAKKLGIKLPSLKNFASKALGVSGKGLGGALEAGAKIFAGMTLSTIVLPLAPIIIGVFATLAFLTILIPIISGGALVQSELGGPGRGTESGIEGAVVAPEGNHLADKTQIAMGKCSMNPVIKADCLKDDQKQIWIDCLVGEGIDPGDAQRAVNLSCESAENFETLQCVGYKKAVEPSFPGGHNACWFANSSNQVPKQIDSVQVGDNAVWGSDCCDQCDLGNLGCCGHIGIITKIEPGSNGNEGWIYVTSAQGGSGNVNTIRVPLTDPTVILRY